MKAEPYRVYELNTVVMIHGSHPSDMDESILLEMMKEIGGLASGDVIMVFAKLIKPEEEEID
jgi:hypothetical protein